MNTSPVYFEEKNDNVGLFSLALLIHTHYPRRSDLKLNRELVLSNDGCRVHRIDV
jgi:hypothetical protein